MSCPVRLPSFTSPTLLHPHRAPRAAMALSKLSDDEQRILFTQLRNVLEPRRAVYLSSVSNALREPTLALLQQLKADHEVAAALRRKMGMSCKELREAKKVSDKGLSVADLATLGSLGSVLPALEVLLLLRYTATRGSNTLHSWVKRMPASSPLSFDSAIAARS